MPAIPRIPQLPNIMRRARVPDDLESVTTVGEEVDPADVGLTRDNVERIWRDTVNWYRSGIHPAIQICVRREGGVVLDRAIGHAKGNGPSDPPEAEKVLATTETPFCVFSASKAVTAFLIHSLHERKIIDIEKPVCEYIPGYERHGKEGITIAHVLAHRAGVPNLPKDVMDVGNMGDTELVCEVLCDAKPMSPAGDRLAYHAISGGFILGEIVRRVTGESISDVLDETFLKPLGFRWTNYGVKAEDLDQVGLSYETGPPLPPPASTMMARALGAPMGKVIETSNDPRFYTGGSIPAGNVVTTANELSRFFEIFRVGGELDGVRVMEPETINHALREQSHLEIDFSLGFPTRFSYGMMLGAQLISLYGRDTQRAFGHLGFTNIMGWADRERKTSVAFINNGKPTLYPEVTRFLGLPQRIATETLV